MAERELFREWLRTIDLDHLFDLFAAEQVASLRHVDKMNDRLLLMLRVHSRADRTLFLAHSSEDVDRKALAASLRLRRGA